VSRKLSRPRTEPRRQGAFFGVDKAVSVAANLRTCAPETATGDTATRRMSRRRRSNEPAVFVGDRTEEIPDWMIPALENLRALFTEALVASSGCVDATPRRLVLRATGLPEKQWT